MPLKQSNPATVNEIIRGIRVRMGDAVLGVLIDLSFGVPAADVAKRHKIAFETVVRLRRQYSVKLARLRSKPAVTRRIMAQILRENVLSYGFRVAHQADAKLADLVKCADIATKTERNPQPDPAPDAPAAETPAVVPPGDVGQALGGAD